MKDPVGAARAANRVLGLGRTAAARAWLIRLRRRMAGIAMPSGYYASGEPSRTSVSPKLHPYRSARGTLLSLVV